MSSPNLQQVEFTLKRMTDNNQAFLFAVHKIALIHLRHTRAAATLRCPRNRKANNAHVHCLCLAQGLHFFTGRNIHANTELSSQKNFFQQECALFCMTLCNQQSGWENIIANNPKLIHRNVHSQCKGVGGWAHACSLYSGVNSRAPHTKPLDEDIKQGFHSPRSFSLSFSHCFRWLAPGRSWAGASLDLLVNRIRATQVSSEGNSALAQSPQTVQHVQSLVVRHRTKAQYEVGGPALTRRSKNQ